MKLHSVTIEGLYGRFNYSLPLGNEDDIAIITAPNGFGKTAVISIVYGVLSRNLDLVLKYQFSAASFVFDDLSVINVRPASPDVLLPDKRSYSVIIETIAKDKDPEMWEFDAKAINEEIRIAVDRYIPYVHRTSNGFVDGQTGELLTAFEIKRRYSDYIPQRIQTPQIGSPNFLSITEAIKCHLIETQRLVKFDYTEMRHPTGQRKSSTTVEQNAADLATRIEAATKSYASSAQRLDQTFPQRVLKQLPGAAPTEESLRSRLKELETKRQNLAKFDLVEKTVGPFLTDYDRMSDDIVRNILQQYAADTATKLGTFDEIYEKVELFVSIVNEHFTFKSLKISADRGMYVVDDHGVPIDLSALSSGEQHILVLTYDLLFRVGAHSLILVDEPELSLHVAWQKRFISDLQKIQLVQPMSVLVATHSPQIINDRWDLEIPLESQT